MIKRTSIAAIGSVTAILLAGCAISDIKRSATATAHIATSDALKAGYFQTQTAEPPPAPRPAQGSSSSSDCPRAGTMLTVTRSKGAELWVTSDPDDSRIYRVAPWNAGLTATGQCVPARSGVLPMIGTQEGWVFQTDVDW
jgi:hypothetical protein